MHQEAEQGVEGLGAAQRDRQREGEGGDGEGGEQHAAEEQQEEERVVGQSTARGQAEQYGALYGGDEGAAGAAAEEQGGALTGAIRSSRR
ncbi:hypothetical protein [Streptomyces showdoensis]|uniref:hypothetical protein n=1 Tax=Streptomyces showdoensis TaxID=68268 RepID=UPI0031EFB468